MKIHSWHLVLGLLLLIGTGCTTRADFLADKQAMALQTALRQAKFDMNCSDPNATVLSQEVVQPVVMQGIWRAEYTIGVAGCDKRHTYVVICPDEGEGCFATGSGRFMREY